MGLQVSLGLQQQLIVLIVSLPLDLHPSPLGFSSFSTRGLYPSPLGPSSFSTWAFSLYLASFRILITYLAHGLEIYPKAHENPRAFPWISGTIYLESSIQCPCGVGLHHSLHLGKDLTSNLEILHTLGSFPQHL